MSFPKTYCEECKFASPAHAVSCKSQMRLPHGELRNHLQNRLREAEEERDKLFFQLGEERKRFLEQEREYVLPLFDLARELGFDLQKAVHDNPGKNCNELFIAKIQDMIRLNGELKALICRVDRWFMTSDIKYGHAIVGADLAQAIRAIAEESEKREQPS